MGKQSGFLDYTRLERPEEAPLQRIEGFGEFRLELPAEQRREQGGRCMNCGVPFCQSEYGCPLHNLIPEWNDELWAGNLTHAARRLLKTNSFPEFTGRVCPALCENACVNALYGDAVTVRDNELAIIEAAWAHGLMAPDPPAVRTDKRVAVVGSGPSGLSAAELLNRRGHRVTVYERADRPGGLLMYGIPGMKLDKKIVSRRIEKMTAEGIAFVCGTEIGRDITGAQLKEEYDAVILCCGARQERPLGVETAGISGIVSAVTYLTGVTKALLSKTACEFSAEGKHVVIVGNGDTATDCVATALRQKAASVTQLVRKPMPESAARIWPYPSAGVKTAYGQIEAAAVFGHDPRLYSTSVKELLADDTQALRAVVVDTAGETREIPAGLLLTATGFSGAEPDIAASFGLVPDKRGRLGDEHFRTSDPRIFACGDVHRGASLVVWALAEGRACAKVVDEALEGYTNL